MLRKPNILFLFLAFLNTIILFLLTSWFWSLPWLAGDEKLLIWATSTIKFVQREIPDSRDYALVNVSDDLRLIDKYDEYGFPVGNQAVTDRVKLTRFFHIINDSPVKPEYILCDIFFENSSNDDSLLNIEMSKLENLVVSSHLGEDKSLKRPVIGNIKYGLSDYVIGNIFEGIYKFQLYFQDSIGLTSLLMAQEIDNSKSNKSGPFVKYGNTWTLNYFIMNYRLLQKDIRSQDTGFNPVNLGELLILPEEDITHFLENKILIIGDFFNGDMHETIFEVTAGPLILLNAYLSIINRDTYINFLFFLILGITFLVISYIAIYPFDFIEEYIRKKYGRILWARNLTSFMSYLIILTVASTGLFFIFNIHINVFFLSIYLFIVEKISTRLFAGLVSKNR